MFGIRGNMMVVIALFGFIPVGIAMFAFLPPRRAVIYDFLIAWLFLPMSHLPLHGFTDYNKMSAACGVVLLCSVVFDLDSILKFRPSFWDIPMLVWCFCPYISSYYNGYSPYDGCSAVAYQTTIWGMPYFIGRIYFNDLKGIRELAIGIIIGGLLYVPLCWYEIRMSPQLHAMVYGYGQYEFAQSKRFNGYRPMVFMQHGLAVAMWMTSAAITAFWLWWSKAATKVMGINIGWAAIILLVTAIGCHSLGSGVLMLLGLSALILTRITGLSIWIIGMSLIPPTWMVVRSADIWTGRDLIHFIDQHDGRAAQSLQVRLASERVLVDRALKRPVYGWTSWKFRDLQTDEGGGGVPDQMWIIAFGKQGLIGLVSFTIALLLPLLLLAWRIPVRYWQHPGAAPAAALGVLATLHLCDMLFNAMVNPLFILCTGGLTGLAFTLRGQAQQTPVYNRPMAAPMGRALPPGSRPATA